MKLLIWIKNIVKNCSGLYSLFLAVQDFVFLFIQRIFAFYAKDVSAEIETKSCLVIAPHPDDETLGCGVTISRVSKARQPVRIIIVTDGRASSQSTIITPEELAAIRRTEAQRAGAMLGVDSKNIIFLSYRDGEASLSIDKIASDLRQQIKDFAPQQIFSPYGVDGHPDHRAVAAAIDKLIRNGNITCPVYQYPIWLWSFSVWWKEFCSSLKIMKDLLHLRRVNAKKYLKLKKAVMTEYRSQCENLTGEASWSTLPPNFLPKFLVPYEMFFENTCEKPLTKK